MIAVESEVLIRAPASEVFDFVINAENDRAWMGSAIRARKLTPGPIGRGTQFSQVGAVLGFQVSVVWEITHFDAGRRMKGETTSGPGKFWGAYSVRAAPSGTRLRKSGRIQLGGVLGLASPLLAGFFQRALEKDLARLKALLENPQVHAAARGTRRPG